MKGTPVAGGQSKVPPAPAGAAERKSLADKLKGKGHHDESLPAAGQGKGAAVGGEPGKSSPVGAGGAVEHKKLTEKLKERLHLDGHKNGNGEKVAK